MSESSLVLPAALGVGAAVGLDPFLTLLLFAMAPLLGWLPAEELRALADPSVIAVAAGLFVLELLIERARPLAAYWHLLQAIARPVAGALFAHLIVSGVETEPLIQVVAPITAACVALLVHLAKRGWSTIAWFDNDRHVRPAFVRALEDACVAGFVFLSLDAPRVAGGLALATLGLLFIAGRGVMRAGMFSHLLAWRRSWGSLRPFRWMTEGDLPADLAQHVANIPRPLGRTFKVAKAGGYRLSGTGLFRGGWLVVGASDPWWIARTMRGPRLVSLNSPGPRSERTESLFLQVGAEGGPGEPSLILPRSGPSLEALNAELSRGSGSTEPATGRGVDRPSRD